MTSTKKRRLTKRSRARKTALDALAIPRETLRVTLAWVRHGVCGLPLEITKALALSPAAVGPVTEEQLLDLFGEQVLRLFDELGPLYGKAGQVLLSRLSPPLLAVAASLRLTRLYKDWPPLPFAEVTAILDREIPQWRAGLTVDPRPLGVASLAQVHGATDLSGQKWVIKVIKPHAKKRLFESLAALEEILSYLAKVAVTEVARRLTRDMRELCLSLRREVELGRERETIARVREKLRSRRQKLLIIPRVNDAYCTDSVLTIERFSGTSLADVAAGKAELSLPMRQKLARTMLSELLVQVFELGLFHADPHAGNLILTEDGALGLFDWGLSGELLESDRRHIASILRAVLTLDQDALILALIAMGLEAGQSVDPEAVSRELKVVTSMIKKGREAGAAKPSLHALFEACLRAAARLGIPVPDGLLMMAKALITIEGLARGLDPNIAFARVATPVLLRAARPGFKDVLKMGRLLPQVARQIFARGI